MTIKATLLRSLGFGVSTALLALAMSTTTFAAPPEHAKGNPPPHAGKNPPLVLEEQGGFSFGGKIEINESGTPDVNTYSRHCDHGYANFLIPKNARELPIIMWHSTHVKTWESNPSFLGGAKAYDYIFASRGWPVYLIDPPRQGRANYGCFDPDFVANWPEVGRDRSFISWRLGTWEPPAAPEYFPGSRMAPLDNANGDLINQILRARYPDNEHVADAFPTQVAAAAELLEDVGPSILFTHSGSGYPGWLTVIESPNVKSVVSFEPGYAFPTGEVPPGQREVSVSDFQKLTEIPILIVIGDRYPEDQLATAQLWVDTVNNYGGNAELYHLPEMGIVGNSHVMMLEENNAEIADLVSQWLKDKGLDKR